jgi:hypothetical protein
MTDQLETNRVDVSEILNAIGGVRGRPRVPETIGGPERGARRAAVDAQTSRVDVSELLKAAAENARAAAR